MVKDANLTLRVPADLKAELVKLAKREDRSLAYVTLRLLREGLEREAHAAEAREAERAGKAKGRKP
jgi:predicted transcriptional regulator